VNLTKDNAFKKENLTDERQWLRWGEGKGTAIGDVNVIKEWERIGGHARSGFIEKPEYCNVSPNSARGEHVTEIQLKAPLEGT
jgi:hypothetical protein